MDAAEVKKKVDRLAELDRQMVAVKGEMETIKAWFEKQATDDLRDTKSKTVEYWGSENSKVVVGNSETVKPISMTMVKKLLGDVFKDFVKEDVSYSMSAPAKRLFSMMYMGNFTEGKSINGSWNRCSTFRWALTMMARMPWKAAGQSPRKASGSGSWTGERLDCKGGGILCRLFIWTGLLQKA